MYNKIIKILSVSTFALLLSACQGELQGHDLKLNRAQLQTYDSTGQKSEQVNFKHLKQIKEQGFNLNTVPDNKLPIQAQIYKAFNNKFTKHTNVLLIKSPQGQLNDTNDTSSLITTTNGNKLFAYNVSYAVYPSSTVKAMYTNREASNEKQQKTVNAKQITPSPDDNNEKSKK